MEIIKAIVLLIVEALMQALPDMLKDKARVVEADEHDEEVRESVTRAFSEFEGVDFDALDPVS